MDEIMKIKEWDDIEEELGSEISQFNQWLEKNVNEKPEELTILVTGIFENDYERYKNENKRNT